MHSLIIVLSIFMVLPVAVPSCDSLTQYENKAEAGKCCKKCGPGTRMDLGTMMDSSNCQDPLCKPCKDDEYQAGWVGLEEKCDLHGYCDNNKNKESASRSTTSKGTCRCKTGYHCAGVECITCELHTNCSEGHRIQFRGNHSHDTVCQKCPPDTVSDGTSEKCNCGPGHRAKTQGSPSSDTICEKGPAEPVKWIVPLICILGLLIVIVIIYVIYKSSAKAKVKSCVESCRHGAEDEPEANPTVDQHIELLSEREPQQEDSQDTKTPEENVEDQHNEQLSEPLISNEQAVTENGNMLVQEDGKSELLSRQESQTQESIESFK